MAIKSTTNPIMTSKSIIHLILFIIIITTSSSVLANQFSQAIIDEFEHWLATQPSNYLIAGQFVHKKNTYYFSNNLPNLTSTSEISINSLNKLLTFFVFAKTIHDQPITFNTPIKQLLPTSLRYADLSVSELTLNKIMHSALTLTNEEFFNTHNISPSDLYIWLSELQLNYLSSINHEIAFALLQHLLTRIHKSNYENLLLTHLLMPMDLSETKYETLLEADESLDPESAVTKQLMSTPNDLLELLRQINANYHLWFNTELPDMSVTNFQFLEQIEEYILFDFPDVLLAIKPNNSEGFFILSKNNNLTILGKKIIALSESLDE